MPGVQKVEISFALKEAYVHCGAGKVDAKTLTSALEKAGYGGSFKRWGGPAAGDKFRDDGKGKGKGGHG